MSSAEFETTFEHAAAIVQGQCGSHPEVIKVLDDFRRRIRTDTHDPLDNRDLMVEPRHDAQVLEVPADVVEQVSSELNKLHILHVWARARCPSVEEDEDATIVETNSPREFRDALESPCPHCGQVHEDLDWDRIETFYAFHFNMTPDRFRTRNFFRRARPRPGVDGGKGPPSRFDRLITWVKGGQLFRFFPEGHGHR